MRPPRGRSIVTDLVTFGESMLRYSPPGRTRLETTDTLDVRIAGAESNVATAASRLGTDAVWVSKLPDSPLGRRVVNFHRSVGLDTDVVWSDEGRVGTYYIEFGGDPRGTNVIYDRADAAVTTATAEELPTERIAEAATFQTTGITPALSETLAQTTADLLEFAADAGTQTVFDLNYRSKLWDPQTARETITELYPHIDVMVAAERDATEVLGYDGDPETVARSLAEDGDFEVVILTRGAWGAIAVADGEYLEQRAFEAETYDPIGTGDAFVGGFLARSIEGASVAEALEWGAATAALKRTIPGDIAVITREEVEQVVEEGAGGIQR